MGTEQKSGSIQLGNQLAGFRAKKGLSQNEVAEKLNVTRQTVSKWETGMMSPSLKSLNQLSQLYNVPLHDLVGSPLTDDGGEKKVVQKSTVKNLKNVTVVVCVFLIGLILGGMLMWKVMDASARSNKPISIPMSQTKHDVIQPSQADSTFHLD